MKIKCVFKFIIDMNSEEADSILNNKGCADCRSGEQQRFQLSCDHIFCLTCVAFSHLKFQQQMKDELNIKCLQCGYISKIDENALKLIKQIIKTKILPYVAKAQLSSYQSDLKEDHHTFSQSMQASNSKKGSASKGHFSSKQLCNKLESPKESISNKKQACPIHSHEELAFICFTCQSALLCLRCVHQKKHVEHEIKSLLKGIEIVREQVDLHRMQSKEHVDYLRMWYRRLDDRKILIRHEWERSSEEISTSFDDLLRKLQQKSKQITNSCKAHFNNLLQDVQSQIQKVSHSIDMLNHHILKLNDLGKSNISPARFVKESMNALKQVDIKKVGNLQINLQERFSYPSNNIQAHISHISQMLHNLEIQYKFTNLKPQSPILQSSKSQEKLKDHPFKRIKTNLISLNSSRDKKERKQKKCTRTEEDEKWNKAKASKGESASKLTKINREIPHYIMQFFQKPSTKPYQNQIECLVQMNTMQNSFKSASKILSKSHLPAQNDFFQKHKKKDNTIVIKERIQRKTAHPTTKEHKSPNHDNLKKKKFNF